MDLWSSLSTNPKAENLLPRDGEVYHLGRLLRPERSARLFEELLELIPWQADQLIMYGKKIETKRKTAWYGDRVYTYTYSGIARKSRLWTPTLLALKGEVEQACARPFNSCLLNLYHHGQEGMSWHADNEKELGPQPCIASLSLGAARKFCFKHNTHPSKIDLLLESGDLLLMQGDTQTFWKHALPKTAQVKTPRINLTFRQILTSL